MEWQFIVALVVAIPIILFPAAFVWYLVVGGIYSIARKAGDKRQAVRQLLHEATEILKNRQALHQLISEAIAAAEEKQAASEEGPDKPEGGEAKLEGG